MWKFLDYDFVKIKELILDKMAASPNTRAVLAFQLLATARIMEILPNPRYKFALKYDDIVINNGFFHIPFVEKRIGFSEKSKRRLRKKDLGAISSNELIKKTKGRNCIIWDKDLWDIFLDYLINQRPNWKGELLEITTLNPDKYELFNEISASGITGRRHWLKKRQKTYEKYSFLFERYRNGYYVDYVIFPFNYYTYRKELAKYKIKSTLFEVNRQIIKEGTRPLYTHFAREGAVNILSEYFDLSFDELVLLLGLKKRDNLTYYFRETPKKLLSAFDKIKNVWKDDNPYLEDIKEKSIDELVLKYRGNKNEKNIKRL